ncbi:MAG: SIS domain-containing protein [Chloroflexi bacterium]|nr:SIS domain-containing protein [Chloroflexota bacterium]MCC6897180.1 SIS domain-containing protein [Anaerolineae bacterium]
MADTALNQNYATYSEIIDQPLAWQATLSDIQANAAKLQNLIQSHNITEVLFTGCGSPYYLALTAAAICRSLTGLRAEAHPSSSVWLFPEMTVNKGGNTLVVAITRSGETTEILKAVEQAHNITNAVSIAVTCYPESSIVGATSFSVIAQDAQEIGLAQTRSFTSMLIATQSIIYALANKPLSPRYLQLPELGREVIEKYQGMAQQLGADSSYSQIFFLGSEPFYGLACEAMLKMKEMTLSTAEAYHFMEFRHGPMAMINHETLIIGLVSEAALAHEVAVLTEMRERGARVLAVTPVQLEASAADYQVVLPEGLTDFERMPLYLPALHVLDYSRTLLKGLNPDRPHSLNAVVNLDVEAIESSVK